MGVGEMTVRVSFFWLPAAVSLASLPLPHVPPHLIVAESHRWQADNHYPVWFRLPALPEHHPSASRANKRPDAESIFKFISTNNASNFTMTDIEDVLDKLKQKSKIVNKQTKKRFELIFSCRRSVIHRQ